jgi:hypothetical protein
MILRKKIKDVHVCSYMRVRFGRSEHVIAHWRSSPGQFVLTF